MRECGECSMCCKVMAVEDLKKPASVWCPHCEIAKGCKIYADRPQECRDFRCRWLDDEMLPDEMRPDKTKVVLSIPKNRRHLQVNCDVDRPDAWREPMIMAYLDLVRQAGVDVVLVVGNKGKLRQKFEVAA